MAVLDKNAVKQKQGEMEESKKKATDGAEESKGEVVDLDSFLKGGKDIPRGEKQKIDKDEDAWAQSAPAPKGRYLIKCFLAKDPVTTYDKDEDKPVGYSIAMECKIVDSPGGEFDRITVFPKVTTFFGRGKQISTAAGLLIKFGFKVPDEADAYTIAAMLVQAIKREQRNIYSSMDSFPKDNTGAPKFLFTHKTSKGQVEEIKASLKVVHWYGKNEASKGESKGNTGGSGAVVLMPVGDSEETGEVKGNGHSQASTSASEITESDLVQLLEEE
jgi:hypothetical protein